jgi:hypothetical protein
MGMSWHSCVEAAADLYDAAFRYALVFRAIGNPDFATGADEFALFWR